MRDDKTMAAAILNPPFAIHARRAGLKDMGPVVDTDRAVSRHCALCAARLGRGECRTLVAYLAACIEGLRWSLDPANRTAAIGLYADG